MMKMVVTGEKKNMVSKSGDYSCWLFTTCSDPPSIFGYPVSTTPLCAYAGTSSMNPQYL